MAAISTTLKTYAVYLKNHITYYLILIIIYTVINYYIRIPGLSETGHHALGVFGIAVFLWIGNLFPLAVTGLIILMLLPASGALKTTEIYAYFGNPAIFFILGAFILASPVMRSGLSKRFSIILLYHFGKGSKRLIFAIFLLSSCLSFIISEHAVAAMLYPIVFGITKLIPESENAHKRYFTFSMMMAVTWGAIIGGTATLLGGARAALSLGLLESMTHKSISFIDWTLYVFPTILFIQITALLILLWINRASQVNISEMRIYLKKEYDQMTSLSIRAFNTLLVLGITILLWIFYGTEWGLDWIALLGVTLAFIFKISTWKEIEEDVQWGIILMYGSAIALSMALNQSGAAHALISLMIKANIHSHLGQTGLIIAIFLIAYILTELMSNTAAVALLMPISLTIAQEYGINPIAITLGIATCAGLTFVLPVSTPALALILENPLIEQKTVIQWGFMLKLIAFIIFSAIAFLYWPMH